MYIMDDGIRLNAKLEMHAGYTEGTKVPLAIITALHPYSTPRCVRTPRTVLPSSSNSRSVISACLRYSPSVPSMVFFIRLW